MKETILLVEDNPHIMAINAEFLEDCGYTVIQAETCAEAERIFAEVSPNLIVLDIMLPDGDGVALCEKLRNTSRVPVLFLSAKDGNDNIIDGLNRGGDDYLTKPYDMRVLLARIEALLRRVGDTRDYILRVGGLELDQQMRTARIDGESLCLNQKEFLVLMCLVKNRDRQVPKTELYKVVWDQELADDSAALWTTVSRLKAKLKPYSEHLCVDSDRSGYRIIWKD